MSRIKTIITAAIVLLVTVISMSNFHTVTIDLLVTDINAPLILIILIMLIAGFITGYILKGIIDYRKDR
ncbi:MAG: DUF1049 domain-containing protein [Spirochaetes bacterium]|nr:DUF1049 domain-containing protein [Spirochaetota bacterium]